KTEQQIRCITLVDIYNYELNLIQIVHLNARYRQFNDDIIQDLRFLQIVKSCLLYNWKFLKKNIHSMFFINKMFIIQFTSYIRIVKMKVLILNHYLIVFLKK